MRCMRIPERKNARSWSFVSMPDFLNVDCDYPQEGWEGSLSYILESVKEENPDFLVVAGDLVMGHWDAPEWNDRDTIAKYSNRYYSAWKQRMVHHGLQFYTSIGDHEVGDNPWKTPKKLEAVQRYKKAFAEHLKMPENGPDHMKGTAFWWRHKNVLFISTDVFEEGISDQGMIKSRGYGQATRLAEKGARSEYRRRPQNSSGPCTRVGPRTKMELERPHGQGRSQLGIVANHESPQCGCLPLRRSPCHNLHRT